MTNRAYEGQNLGTDWTASSVVSGRPTGHRSAILGGWRIHASATGGGSVFPSSALFGNPATHDLSEQASNPSQQTALSPGPPSPEPQALTEYEIQMTRFAVEQEEDFKKLRKEYVLVEGPSVEAFLRGHRSLIEVLLDAAAQIKACFGVDNVLQLRLGGEEGDAPNLVYGVIQWSGSLDAARAALDAFDESWWVANVRKASGRVVFDFELA